jgi:ABC-type transport system involved in multi-copper enzyme maturation permease subunit
MDEFFSINNLLLIDGAVMLLIGINMMVAPAPASVLRKKPDSHAVMLALKQTRRVYGLLFVTVGILLCLIGYYEDAFHVLTVVGRFRALTLAVLIFFSYRQVQSGIWKKTRIITLISFAAIFFVLYIFFGFIADSNSLDKHEQVPFEKRDWEQLLYITSSGTDRTGIAFLLSEHYGIFSYNKGNFALNFKTTDDIYFQSFSPVWKTCAF